MKKAALKISVLLTGLISLIFFSGCTLPDLPFLPKPKPDEQPITLTYWGLWEPKANIQPLIEEYQNEHSNVTINYEERSPKFYYETLVSRLSSGTGPDIFRSHITWIPQIYENLAALPASIIDAETYKNSFYPIVEEWCKTENQYYCVPLMYEGLALIYNEELFEKAGLSKAPETWEEFREYAQKLTLKDEEEKITQAGAAIGSTENVTQFSDVLGLLMLQNGTEFQDETTGEVTFHTSISPDGRNTGAEALSFYSLFAKGEDKVWDDSWEESTRAFAAGKVGMIFASSWRVLNIINANPSLKMKVAAVPQIPTSDGGTTNINWGSFWVEGVSGRSEHQAEAWDFLKFLSEREQLLSFYKTASATRTFGEIYSRQDLASTLLSNPYLGPYLEGASTAETWYMCDKTWDESLNDKIKAILAQAIDGVIGGSSADGAISSAGKAVEALLNPTE